MATGKWRCLVKGQEDLHCQRSSKNECASYQATEDNIRAIITQLAAGNSQWVYIM